MSGDAETMPLNNQGFLRAHDDLFQKQIIVKGQDPYVTPVESCLCEFSIELINENVDESIEVPRSPIEIGFHQSRFVYIISRALQTMSLNEKSRFSFEVNSQVMNVELVLNSFDQKPEVFQWNQEDRLSFCYKLKAFATELFQAHNYYWAFHTYHRSLVFLTIAEDDDNEERLKETKVQLISNISLCQSQLMDQDSQYAVKSVQNLTKVLNLDPNNMKALFRRGKYYVSTNDFEKAEADLEKAHSLDPNNQAVIEQKKLLKKKLQENDDFTASAMAKFFATTTK